MWSLKRTMELPSHHRPKQVFHGRLGDKTTDFRGVYFGLANFCPRGSPFKERLLKRRKADRWKGTSKTPDCKPLQLTSQLRKVPKRCADEAPRASR